MIQILVTLAVVLVAIWFDWKEHKIPNWLTASAILIGFGLHFWNQDLHGLEQSALGLVCGILLLFLPFALGGVGGGDVKLMGAVGSLLGPAIVFKIFLASAIFGGLFSCFVMIKQKAVRKTLKGVRDRLIYFAVTKKVLREECWEESKTRLKIPYAFAIGCGTFLVLLA